MVIDDTGSVEDIHAFIYCKKWRSGQVSRMPHSLTDSQRKDRATQLLIKYKSGALVTQLQIAKKEQFENLVQLLLWTASLLSEPIMVLVDPFLRQACANLQYGIVV